MKKGFFITLEGGDGCGKTTQRQKLVEFLEKKGIKCVTFNQFKPFFIVSHNNRDHRKITVIDGKVGFTGGINLADEYINKKERHGYWKDASVMIQGEAVWSLTVIFLQL